MIETKGNTWKLNSDSESCVFISLHTQATVCSAAGGWWWGGECFEFWFFISFFLKLIVGWWVFLYLYNFDFLIFFQILLWVLWYLYNFEFWIYILSFKSMVGRWVFCYIHNFEFNCGVESVTSIFRHFWKSKLEIDKELHF